MRPAVVVGALAWLARLCLGCGSHVHESAPSASVGFVELEGTDYSFGETQLRSSPARIFYGFLPAEKAAAGTPLFVLSGGGPAASAMFLLAYHGLVTPGADGTWSSGERNPWPLNKLGDVLYLDARNAGYSFAELDHAGDRAARDQEFSPDNYNVYRDAADTWRVLFDFWKKYPNLRSSPLYFLAESYGGLRVTTMLNLLLYADQYGTESRPFYDPALFTELGALVSAGVRVSGQVLLEPLFAGGVQTEVTGQLYEAPGSILHQLASESGTAYLTCAEREGVCNPYMNALDFVWSIDRSPYDYRQSGAWLDTHTAVVTQLATQRAALARILGVSVAALDGALGKRGAGAYRFADASYGDACPRGDLEQVYGTLQPWDAHFVAIHREALSVYSASSTAALRADAKNGLYGELFLENLRSVPTLLSRADYDLVIYGPALSPVLTRYSTVKRATTASREIQIEFLDGTARTIFSPIYQSSHSVSRDCPAELFSDLAQFVDASRQ